MKSWFTIKNMMDDVIDISIHEEIGMFGVSASDFMTTLNENKSAKVINLSIHSSGGSLLDGLAIYNSLLNHGAKVYGRVAGVAASAASFILMASDVIEMPEDSFLMIHNAQGGGFGDAEYLRDIANVIDKLQESIINIYDKRTNVGREKIIEMMKEETWISAEEASDMEFINKVTDKIGAVAKINVQSFKNCPLSFKDSKNDIQNIKEFEKFLRDSADLSKKQAMKMVSKVKEIMQGDLANSETDFSEIKSALMRFKIPNK